MKFHLFNKNMHYDSNNIPVTDLRADFLEKKWEAENTSADTKALLYHMAQWTASIFTFYTVHAVLFCIKLTHLKSTWFE